jgi:hypothetical protein
MVGVMLLLYGRSMDGVTCRPGRSVPNAESFFTDSQMDLSSVDYLKISPLDHQGTPPSEF